MSLLQVSRRAYTPKIPNLLKGDFTFTAVESNRTIDERLKKLFPFTAGKFPLRVIEGKGERRHVKIGVVFSGGPAPGGHNVIAGLCDSGARVLGFLGGPSGIVLNKSIEVSLELIAKYRNLGGFDLLGSGRTKLESREQLEAARQTVEAHSLDGLVVIGGDDSNTNAAVLAEYFLSKETKTCVIGVPKTIDGDLQSKEIEISFGFDSATKTYSEMIGNIARDALSARKYYHFIKLMGRSASHIALECALATHPNLTLIGEEQKSFRQIVNEVADLVIERSKLGKEYGVVLIPEGLIEFIPELKSLIRELEKNLSLSPSSRDLFESFPKDFQNQLQGERDPHGNIALSQIETEKLLIEMVSKELKERRFEGKFQPQSHFFGYEGRSCFPTNFDANYCYSLGLLAASAVQESLTGMICSIQNMGDDPSRWELTLVPLTHLMSFEERQGNLKPVIRKTLVDLNGFPFVFFKSLRKKWEVEDDYCDPGPIQFSGDPLLTDSTPMILSLSIKNKRILPGSHLGE